MDLNPFLKTLYNVSPKNIFPSSIEDLKYKIANVIQSYFGEFRIGSLYLGLNEPITPDELSDIISMQESDTTDYLNTAKVLGLSSNNKYKDTIISTNNDWVDYSLSQSLSDFYTKKIKNFVFQFSIIFNPDLYHYNVDVLLSYPEKENGSIQLSFTVTNNMNTSDLFIESNNIKKKYTGYYACEDGSMDAEFVINKFNLSWNRANVLKYIIRAGKKDPNKEIEDLEKARNYISYEIERIRENKIL